MWDRRIVVSRTGSIKLTRPVYEGRQSCHKLTRQSTNHSYFFANRHHAWIIRILSYNLHAHHLCFPLPTNHQSDTGVESVRNTIRPLHWRGIRMWERHQTVVRDVPTQSAPRILPFVLPVERQVGEVCVRDRVLLHSHAGSMISLV